MTFKAPPSLLAERRFWCLANLNVRLASWTVQIANTIRSTSMWHRSDAFASDRCQIDVDPMVLAIWKPLPSQPDQAWRCRTSSDGGGLGKWDRRILLPGCLWPVRRSWFNALSSPIRNLSQPPTGCFCNLDCVYILVTCNPDQRAATRQRPRSPRRPVENPRVKTQTAWSGSLSALAPLPSSGYNSCCVLLSSRENKSEASSQLPPEYRYIA